MIKFSSNINDKRLLGLGLSDENIKRLTKGQPILIRDNELQKLTGWEGYILIMHGKTEEAMEQELREYFGGKK
jgi:hypothetical protein